MDGRILVLAVAIGVAACADDRATSRSDVGARLSAAELSGLYPGGPYDGSAPTGSPFTVTVAADRTAAMRFADGRADTGRWRIDGDHVCFTWTWVGEGKERCGHIERLADGQFRSVDAQGNEILRFARR